MHDRVQLGAVLTGRYVLCSAVERWRPGSIGTGTRAGWATALGRGRDRRGL